VSGLSQLTPGMPALDSVKKVIDFVSPEEVKYKILKTTEMDAYDPQARHAKNRSKNRGDVSKPVFLFKDKNR